MYKKEHPVLNGWNDGVGGGYSDNDGGHNGDSDVYDDVVEGSYSFRHSFQKFLRKQMGSGDIYCCPVCYAEAQRRFCGKDASDDETSDIEDENDEHQNTSSPSSRNQQEQHDGKFSINTIISSRVDPMTILGGLDDDEFEVASTMCFKTISTLKAHIRDVHGLDTQALEGNELYKRFMVRYDEASSIHNLYFECLLSKVALPDSCCLLKHVDLSIKIRETDGLLQKHLIAFY